MSKRRRPDLGHIVEGLRPLAVKISTLRPDGDNVRVHGERNLEAIAESLKAFGQQKPIVVDPSGQVIAGNATLAAAEQLGWEHLAIVVSGLRGRRRAAYAIADNRTAELAEWDASALARQIDELSAAGEAQATGFSAKEIDELIAELKAQDGGLTDPDHVPDPPDKPVTRGGDLWILGDHRLLCGDARDGDCHEKVLAGERAPLAVTSPPYGVGKAYEEQGIEAWFETVRPVIAALAGHADVIVWNIGDATPTGSQFIEPTFAYSIRMFEEHGYRPLWVRIWMKPGMNFGGGPYWHVTNKPAPQYECLAALAGEDCAESPDMDRESLPDVTDFEWLLAFAHAKHRFVKRLSISDRRQWGWAGVWRMNTVKANDDHPAKFPAELPSRAIKMHSDSGDLVLDPFGGSGTTMIAAEALGRRGRLIELDEKYCDVAVARWQEFTGAEAVLESMGKTFAQTAAARRRKKRRRSPSQRRA